MLNQVVSKTLTRPEARTWVSFQNCGKPRTPTVREELRRCPFHQNAAAVFGPWQVRVPAGAGGRDQETRASPQPALCYLLPASSLHQTAAERRQVSRRSGKSSSPLTHALRLNPCDFLGRSLAVLARLVDQGGSQQRAGLELADREPVHPRLLIAGETPQPRTPSVPLPDLHAVRPTLAEE